MTKKNPEISENMETPETKQELNNLEINILNNSKDRKRFETLSQDSVLKKWLEKIFKKSLENKVNEFEKNHNKYSKESVDYYTSHIIKWHPELISFIAWELNLPIRNEKDKTKVKFSQLTFDQKLSFMALMEVFWDYNGDSYKKAKTSNIIDKYWKYMDKYTKEATDNFNKEMDKNKNIVWLIDLEKVLINNYWLNDAEYAKFKEYIELIQKHPEFVWWRLEKFKLQQAWWWDRKSFRSAVKVIVIVWGMIRWLNQIKWCYSLKTPETRVYWDHTEITNFKKVFKAMSAQAETFSNRREFKEEGYGHIDESWWFFIWGWKKIINGVIDAANSVQSRKLDLELKTEIGYLFDFDTVQCTVEIKDWKWYFYVKVKKPEVKITNTEAKIHKSSRERINMDKFDDFELRAVETLKKEAIDEASKPEKIEKAKEYLRENLLSHFQVTWFANSQMTILAEDVQDVIVEYEDEKPRYYDPENKKTLVNN